MFIPSIQKYVILVRDQKHLLTKFSNLLGLSCTEESLSMFPHHGCCLVNLMKNGVLLCNLKPQTDTCSHTLNTQHNLKVARFFISINAIMRNVGQRFSVKIAS